MKGLYTHLFPGPVKLQEQGYHQRRLKLKTEKILQRKMLISAGMKEHWSKRSSPYLAYIASHWKKLAAENPKMNGYQLQKMLWKKLVQSSDDQENAQEENYVS